MISTLKAPNSRSHFGSRQHCCRNRLYTGNLVVLSHDYQRKLGQRDSAKRTAKVDIWLTFQPELGQDHSAKRPSRLGNGHQIQPKLGQDDSAWTAPQPLCHGLASCRVRVAVFACQRVATVSPEGSMATSSLNSHGFPRGDLPTIPTSRINPAAAAAGLAVPF